MSFNPLEDKIALVIKNFTLKKKGEGFLNRFSEPYILSMVIDESGANNPAIDFNVLPYPKVAKGETVTFGGQGHLMYGPKNPGEFLAYTAIFMESDQDVRKAGNTIEGIIKSEAAKSGIKDLLTLNPAYGTAINVLGKLSELVVGAMKENKDDELYRISGTFLRGTSPAYDVSKIFPSQNKFIKTEVAVIPLNSSSNMLGSGKKIEL